MFMRNSRRSGGWNRFLPVMCALALWPLVPSAQAQTELWSATLTIAEPNAEDGPEGYCSDICASGDYTDYGSLDVATFMLNSTTYTVKSGRLAK